MTKANLVAQMSKDAGVTKAAAEKALGSFTKAVSKVLSKGGKVTLVGFGTFSVRERKARKGRNPQTGREMMLKAKKVPKFSAGKALKSAIK
ncbi:MAG: HU family DNA-binding protein [bacterium]